MKKVCFPILFLIVCWVLSPLALAQSDSEHTDWQWQLGPIIHDIFVNRYGFEYYYMPAQNEIAKKKNRGEQTFFLNTPSNYSTKQAMKLIDRLLGEQDARPICKWALKQNHYEKEYRCKRSLLRFTVARNALEGEAYFVSATEWANYFKVEESQPSEEPIQAAKKNRQPIKRDRHQIDEGDIEMANQPVEQPDKAEQKRLKQAEKAAKKKQKEEEQARLAQERLLRKQAQEQEKAEKARQKQERKLAEQQWKLEQAQKDEKQRQAQLAEQKLPTTYKKVALQLSERYGYNQADEQGAGCMLYSTSVNDEETVKSHLKEVLKQFKARMAIPWTYNDQTKRIETGYKIGENVLVIAIGRTKEGYMLVTIHEVTAKEYQEFQQQHRSEQLNNGTD